MESWAPSWTAEPWDRVGLVVGESGAEVRRAWVALELGEELLDQAQAAGVQMLLLHHPPLFKPLERLLTDQPATARLLRAATQGMALFAAHTNLDAAPAGVNDALARRLGLVELEVLAPLDRGLLKLVTFVPPEHRPAVAEALFQAGAGRIGDYRECAFRQRGMGGFLAPAHGDPFIGTPGQREEVEEERLEVVLPEAQAGRVLESLRRAHPYEEPAYDLYPLRQGPSGVGLGRVGRLERPLEGKEFLERAARRLGAHSPSWSGPLPRRLERVAVVGGSGGDLLPLAAAAGAQLMVTGEAHYHHYEMAEDLKICLAVMGHFQTEVVIVEPWARRLGRMLETAGLSCVVEPWTGGRDPWRPIGES